MRAAVIHGAGDIRVEDVPDPGLREPTDAVVRIIRSAICGSDLWPYAHAQPVPGGQRIGHEFMGVVVQTGADVATVAVGDLVLAPFVFSDNTCDFCRQGLQTSCRNGGSWGDPGVDGGQGEAVRVPLADGTLIRLPFTADDVDDTLLRSLLTLCDVFGTGHHAAVSARVHKGCTAAVVGDGAVGLCGVLAARRLGADRIILLGRHEDRTALGRGFGATDVVPERGDEAVARVRDLTGGDGVHAVLECVGSAEAVITALGVVRHGGAIGRVGAARYGELPVGYHSYRHNITLSGGWAPVRAYLAELLPDVLSGRIEPGRVFDRTVALDDVPAGYLAMSRRESLKVLIRG